MGLRGELRGAGGLGRNRWFLCLGDGQETVGVQRNAVFANLKVQMRAGRTTGLAQLTDALAFKDNITNLDGHF